MGGYFLTMAAQIWWGVGGWGHVDEGFFLYMTR